MRKTKKTRSWVDRKQRQKSAKSLLISNPFYYSNNVSIEWIHSNFSPQTIFIVSEILSLIPILICSDMLCEMEMLTHNFIVKTTHSTVQSKYLENKIRNVNRRAHKKRKIYNHYARDNFPVVGEDGRWKIIISCFMSISTSHKMFNLNLNEILLGAKLCRHQIIFYFIHPLNWCDLRRHFGNKKSRFDVKHKPEQMENYKVGEWCDVC